MNHKSLFKFTIIALLVSIFAVFAKVVNAEDLAKKQEIIITLKNDANIDISKNKISEIPNVKIISTKYRDEEWSKMVNKYDLPNMENPFKNEFVVKINKKADINEVHNKIKEMDFVEKTECDFDKNFNADSDKLPLIDDYQAQYFTIIKRNNVLLNLEDEKALNKDRKELKKLYGKVKKQISNKTYLKEYNEIEEKFSKCDDMTDIGMKEFSVRNYNEIDSLLNKVYKEVQSKISPEDFKKLAESEQKWLQEVNNYEKVYNSMSYGTIGALVYYDYQINMRGFRTLLLMLYL